MGIGLMKICAESDDLDALPCARVLTSVIPIFAPIGVIRGAFLLRRSTRPMGPFVSSYFMLNLPAAAPLLHVA